LACGKLSHRSSARPSHIVTDFSGTQEKSATITPAARLPAGPGSTAQQPARPDNQQRFRSPI
jgi:hypothetical protein